MAETFGAHIRSCLTGFVDDTRGATAILFALLAVPVLGLSMAAIDYGRAQTAKNLFQDAADAATTAGAKMLGEPHDVVEGAIRAYLKANLPADHKSVEFAVTFADDDKSVSVKINDTVPTTILGIVGVKQFDVAIESTGSRPDPLPSVTAPSHSVAPEIPLPLAQLPILNRPPEPEDMRKAEQQVRAVLEEIEKSDAPPEVRRLLRILRNRR